MAIDNVGGNVPVKFGGSRSNVFLAIRGADFVSNEHDEAHPNSANSAKRVSPDNVNINKAT